METNVYTAQPAFVLDSTALISIVNRGQQELGRRQLLYLKLSIDPQIDANSHFAL